MMQNRNGLPDAILEEKRFFELRGSGKEDTPAGWNNPENWKHLDDIPEDKYFGFAIGNNSNYLLIDGDHVRDPVTGQLDPLAAEVCKRIDKIAPTYSEISMSGTGFHKIVDLGEYGDCFEPETNSDIQKIVAMDPVKYANLPEAERDHTPKIELFYHARGRYVYLTGKHTNDAKPKQVARNEDAAAIFTELIRFREELHAKYSEGLQVSVNNSENKRQLDDATKERIMAALPFISARERETWVRIGIALSNCGFPFEVWNEWSQWDDQRKRIRCDKYDLKDAQKVWKSFRNCKSRWNEGTIFIEARKNGYHQSGMDNQKDDSKESIASLENNPETETLVSIFGSDAVIDVLADQSEPIPEKEWVIEGIVTKGESGILSSASKAGKSYLSTDLSIAMASGQTWLGKFPCVRAPVLYINGENVKDDARRRFHAVFEAKGVDPADCEPITLICADGQNKTIQDLQEVITNEIRRHDYGLIVLDPLYTFYSGSEIDEVDAKNFVCCVKTICRETGVAVIVIHHHSKAGAAFYRNASSRASGSGMLQRAFSTLLDLTEITGDDVAKLPPGQRAFEFSGQPRQAAEFSVNLIFDFPTWRTDTDGVLPSNARNRGQTAAARANNKNLQKAADVQRNLPEMLKRSFESRAKADKDGDYITLGDAVAEFENIGISISERSISRRIDDGINGYIRDSRAGQRRKIRRVEFVPAAESITPDIWLPELTDGEP